MALVSFQFKRIKTRMLAIIMFGATLGMFALTLVFVINTVNLLGVKRNHQITTELGILSTNIAASVMFEDETSIRELLKGLAVDQDIQFSAVINTDKSLHVLEALNSHLVDLNDRATVDLQLNTLTKFSYPIRVDGEQIGRLEVYASDESLREQVTSTIVNSILIFIVVAVAIYFVSIRLQRAITEPIEYLNRVSQKVTENGDYSLRADIDSKDEIGDLANDFNRMLEQIEQRDTMLEQTVSLRTSELEKLANQFRHRAFHDALTGLPNRALLAERFAGFVENAKRVKRSFGVLLIDLDNFKNINDTLGHDVGDELLQTIANRLQRTLRAVDFICRLGGDEFLIVLENMVDCDNAIGIAEKLLTTFSGDVIVKERRLDITMSIGCSVYPDHGDDLTTLKRAADISMYASKEAGRNQCKLFHIDMEQTAMRRLMVQNDLREGVKDNQLKLYYQPQVDSATGEIYGCEVLVRWLHPKQGLLVPDLFVPYAEESGLVQLVDFFILDEACKQAKQWLNEGQPLVVSVNLSGLHFRDRNVVDRVRQAIESTGLPPQYLGVEITEAVLISDSSLAIDVVNELKALGVKISLDDFGVGYSSLNYLRTLPFDVVKLDKSFIDSILTNVQDGRLTEGIIKLASGLDLKVVAEGIETHEQVKYLAQIHCRYLQGYYFLPPSPKAEFEQWRAQWHPSRIAGATNAKAADLPSEV